MDWSSPEGRMLRGTRSRIIQRDAADSTDANCSKTLRRYDIVCVEEETRESLAIHIRCSPRGPALRKWISLL